MEDLLLFFDSGLEPQFSGGPSANHPETSTRGASDAAFRERRVGAVRFDSQVMLSLGV
jgi:hypothetical protein